MKILQSCIKEAFNNYAPEVIPYIDWSKQTKGIFISIATDFYFELHKEFTFKSAKVKEMDMDDVHKRILKCTIKAVNKYKCPKYGTLIPWCRWSKDMQDKFYKFMCLTFESLSGKLNIVPKKRRKR